MLFHVNTVCIGFVYAYETIFKFIYLSFACFFAYEAIFNLYNTCWTTSGGFPTCILQTKYLFVCREIKQQTNRQIQMLFRVYRDIKQSMHGHDEKQ